MKKKQMIVWEVPAEAIREIEELMRPTHELTATMSEEEINEVLDEALNEVRLERKQKLKTND